MDDGNGATSLPGASRTLSLIRNPEPATRLSATEASSPAGCAERLERLHVGLAPQLTVGNRLTAQVLDAAEGALRRAVDEEEPRFTPMEAAALEAVIITDGSRPSLTVGEDYVNSFAPDARDWGVDLRTFEAGVSRVIASVGRITIPEAPRLIGTALLVADDLVLTNRHVAEMIAVEDANGWRLRWPDQTLVNFVGEAEAPRTPSHVVTGVAQAGPDVIGRDIVLHHLDLALLRISPLRTTYRAAPLAIWPTPGLVTPDRTICLIGFPSRPQLHLRDGSPPPGFETEAAMVAVFGDEFGVKKLAPGRIVQDGVGLAGSPMWPVFSHDCSTLQGNSGSVVVDFAEPGGRIIGMHFGGYARERNYAHDLPALKNTLNWPLRWAPRP